MVQPLETKSVLVMKLPTIKLRYGKFFLFSFWFNPFSDKILESRSSGANENGLDVMCKHLFQHSNLWSCIRSFSLKVGIT